MVKYALRVFPAETRLTVYRRRPVELLPRRVLLPARRHLRPDWRSRNRWLFVKDSSYSDVFDHSKCSKHDLISQLWFEASFAPMESSRFRLFSHLVVSSWSQHKLLIRDFSELLRKFRATQEVVDGVEPTPAEVQSHWGGCWYYCSISRRSSVPLRSVS